MFETLFSIKLIDISSVSPRLAVSDFSNEVIEELAHNFLRTGRNGIPILVEKANSDLNFMDGDLFNLVEGDLIYFACKRAQEQNPLFGSISTIILDKKNENLIKKQWKLLYGNKKIGDSGAVPTDSLEVIEKINNLEQSLRHTINSLADKIDEQQKTIADKTINILANKLNEQQKAIHGFMAVRPTPPSDPNPIKTGGVTSYLNQINTSDVATLTQLLHERWGLSSLKAEELAKLIITERESNGLFTSFINISERVYKKTKTGKRQKAISLETLFKYIDHWISDAF